VDDTTAFYPLMQDSKFFPCGSAQLDSTFYVKELPYYWHTLQITSHRSQDSGHGEKENRKSQGWVSQAITEHPQSAIAKRSDAPAPFAGGNPKSLPFPHLTFYRIVFYAAALYNLLWGAFTLLAPNAFFDALGLARPNYPFLWAGIGLFVAVYAPAYFVVARDPPRYPMLVVVGYLGKLFGPIGWLATVLRGELPPASLIVILFNDLIWWAPFLLYLYDAWRMNCKART
jgi:hypothetical protein